MGAVGPFELQVRFPGYESAATEYVALPLAGGLTTTELALPRRAAGWGDLQLEIRGAPDYANSHPTDTALPTAFVMLRAGDGSLLRLGVSSPGAQRVRFEDIPWGSYRASVPFAHHLGRGKLGSGFEAEVQIGPEVCGLQVDVGGLGGLELEIVDASGGPWRGDVQATIQAENGRGSDPTRFRGPPYRFDGLAPGRYRVQLLTPFRRAPSPGQPDLQGLVEAGKVTLVHVAPL